MTENPQLMQYMKYLALSKFAVPSSYQDDGFGQLRGDLVRQTLRVRARGPHGRGLASGAVWARLLRCG